MDRRLAGRIGHLPLQVFVVTLKNDDLALEVEQLALEVEQLTLKCQELLFQQGSLRDSALGHQVNFEQWGDLEKRRLLTKDGRAGWAGNVFVMDLALLDLLLKFVAGFEQFGTFGFLRSCWTMDWGHQTKDELKLKCNQRLSQL